MKNRVSRWKWEWGKLTGFRHIFLGMPVSLEYAVRQIGRSELPPLAQPFWIPPSLQVQTPYSYSSCSSELVQCWDPSKFWGGTTDFNINIAAENAKAASILLFSNI